MKTLLRALPLLAALGSAAFPAAAETRLADLPGVWQMRGYGQILHVSPERIVTYDLTDISCLRIEDVEFPGAETGFERVQSEGDQLSLYEEGGVTRYVYDRLDRLPLRCALQGASPSADPEYTFAVLWHAFRENYAFFDVHGVNWEEIYTRMRPRVLTAKSDDELFAVVSDALGALQDGHVTLEAGERSFGGGRRGELRELWMKERGVQPAQWRTVSKGYRDAVTQHVERQLLRGRAKKGAKDLMVWGWLRPGVGYLHVTDMYVDAAPGEAEISASHQLALIDEAMSRAIADLAKAKAVVIDVRFNGGGLDSIALRIAGYFTAERRLALTKKAVLGSGYTEPQELYVEPSRTPRYTGPVYVLQSGNTISAAEIFVIAMKALPNATRVGTPTYGVLSDELGKRLPNGWEVTLSNEVYLAADGRCYESIGVPPDVPLAAPSERFGERLRQDVDEALRLIAER